MVPAHSIKVSRVSMYSGYRHVIFPFAYGAFTLSGRLSQNLSARINESIMRSEPHGARTMVWPLSISLAATLEITCCFLFLRLLRCFSSPRSEEHTSELQSSIRQSITYGREPGELKHLSSRRKRKKKSISKVAASEMERAQTGVRALRGSDCRIDE